MAAAIESDTRKSSSYGVVQQHIDMKYLLAMTPEQAEKQRFPIGTTVLHFEDSSPFPKVTIGTVLSVAINILSQDRENVYTISSNQTPETLLAKQSDVHFVSQTPVWCDGEAAIVLGSHQESVSAPALYVIQIIGGPMWNDVQVHRLTFRRDDEKASKRFRLESMVEVTSMIEPRNEQYIDSASLQSVKAESIPTEMIEYHPQSSSVMENVAAPVLMVASSDIQFLESKSIQPVKEESIPPDGIEIYPEGSNTGPVTKCKTAPILMNELPPQLPTSDLGTSKAKEQIIIELLDSDDDDGAEQDSLAAPWGAQSTQKQGELSSERRINCELHLAYRQIILPNWVNPAKLKDNFRPKESQWRSPLEDQTGCLIWMSGNLVRPSDNELLGLVIHVEGASREDLHGATASILKEATTSVDDKRDIHRFLYDIFMANKNCDDFFRYSNKAVWTLLPPDLQRYTWMAIFLLPPKHQNVVRIFTGHKGKEIIKFQQVTNCNVGVCSSKKPYIFITGKTSEAVNNCFEKLQEQLLAIAQSTERTKK